jgi:membrane-bound serine protease (ClpP class)
MKAPLAKLAASAARSRLRSTAALAAFALLGAWLGLSEAPALAASRGTGRVLVARVEGVISPVTVEVLDRACDRAEAEHYEALVIEIDTPGGLETSMRTMIKRMLACQTPILTWVTPSGAHAASAGVFITMAGDVAAMSPGTNIGAATPVNMQGGMDSTLARKATNDAAAFARTVAERRGRSIAWAERAVREAVAASEREAVQLGVVDFVAPSLDSLLILAEGHAIERSGSSATLRVRGLPHDRIDPDLRQKILAILTDPNVAYILLMLGFYGLLFELQNPGAVLPGVVGGICLVLAFLALSTLPVNAAGIALIVLAIVFFVAEIKVASHGVLSAGGIVALVLGSLILFEGGVARVSWAVIGTATVATFLFFMFVVGAGLRAQKQRVASGAGGMIGRRAQAVERLAPDGLVRIDGELWRAVSESPAEVGAEVEITRVDGLTLRVRPTSREART